MRAVQVVEEVILLFVTAKETRKFNFLLVSSGSGPSIAPSLKNLDCNRAAILLQAAKAVLKKNSVVEIKVIREEGLLQSLAEDILYRRVELSKY